MNTWLSFGIKVKSTDHINTSAICVTLHPEYDVQILRQCHTACISKHCFHSCFNFAIFQLISQVLLGQSRHFFPSLSRHTLLTVKVDGMHFYVRFNLCEHYTNTRWFSAQNKIQCWCYWLNQTISVADWREHSVTLLKLIILGFTFRV